MKVGNINIQKSVEHVKALLEKDKNVSSSLQAGIELLLLIISLLVDRLGVNSNNSSKPPSQDPHREKKKKVGGQKNSGGQKGRKGSRLTLSESPDRKVTLELNAKQFPDHEYTLIGYERRQVWDIDIQKMVTEYQAEVRVNSKGERFTADFPEGVTSQVQYGNTVKAHAVYLSQYQLLPYQRVEEYFSDQIGIPLSQGSLYNFIQEAYKRLEPFESFAKETLQNSSLVHFDETGVNLQGKNHWVHNASNQYCTWLYPHKKRGKEAMDDIGVLPKFKGTACHDFWKAYYQYKDCSHSLCNAHLLRELQRIYEVDHHSWARKMKFFLLGMEKQRTKHGVFLKEKKENALKQYQKILEQAQQESPPPTIQKGKRGRPKKTKARNLLERFQNHSHEILRFLFEEDAPFTNNLAERDLRMLKVQQKVSGCFRSLEGAKAYCRIRSFLSTARKQGEKASYALEKLFQGKLYELLNNFKLQ